MRAITLLILLTIGFAASAGAAPENARAAKGYQGGIDYQGPYKAERLYQLDPLRVTWYASQRLTHWRQLACFEARSTLADQGEWVGNLTDAGACAGTSEAPRWATGNYLNFLLKANGAGSGRE